MDRKIIYFHTKNHLLDDFQEQGEFIYENAYTKPRYPKAKRKEGLEKGGLGSYSLFMYANSIIERSV